MVELIWEWEYILIRWLNNVLIDPYDNENPSNLKEKDLNPILSKGIQAKNNFNSIKNSNNL